MGLRKIGNSGGQAQELLILHPTIKSKFQMPKSGVKLLGFFCHNLVWGSL